MKQLSYDECLKKLGLTTLQTRRLRGDLIETHKILTKKERVDINHFFQFADPGYNLRGHSMKLYKSNVRLNIRKHFFSQRVIDTWNDLPNMLWTMWNDDVRRLTKQPKLIAIIQSCRLTLFWHIMCMDDNADAKRILLASPPADWRRQPGRPRIMWLNTVQQDL